MTEKSVYSNDAVSLAHYYEKIKGLRNKSIETRRRLLSLEDGVSDSRVKKDLQILNNENFSELHKIVSSLARAQTNLYGKLLDLYSETLNYVDCHVLGERAYVQRILSGNFPSRKYVSKDIVKLIEKDMRSPSKERGKKRTHYKPKGIFEILARYHGYISALKELGECLSLIQETKRIPLSLYSSVESYLKYLLQKYGLQEYAQSISLQHDERIILRDYDFPEVKELEEFYDAYSGILKITPSQIFKMFARSMNFRLEIGCYVPIEYKNLSHREDFEKLLSLYPDLFEIKPLRCEGLKGLLSFYLHLIGERWSQKKNLFFYIELADHYLTKIIWDCHRNMMPEVRNVILMAGRAALQGAMEDLDKKMRNGEMGKDVYERKYMQLDLIYKEIDSLEKLDIELRRKLL